MLAPRWPDILSENLSDTEAEPSSESEKPQPQKEAEGFHECGQASSPTKTGLRTLLSTSSSLTPGPLNHLQCSCTHLASPQYHPGLQTLPHHLIDNKILSVTFLIKILLTRGQAFQIREHLIYVTENVPEKAPFKEEILNTQTSDTTFVD